MAWQGARPWWAHHSRVFLLPGSSGSVDPQIVSTVQIEEVVEVPAVPRRRWGRARSSASGGESSSVVTMLSSAPSEADSESSQFVHIADVEWQQVGVAVTEQTIVYVGNSDSDISSTSDTQQSEVSSLNVQGIHGKVSSPGSTQEPFVFERVL